MVRLAPFALMVGCGAAVTHPASSDARPPQAQVAAVDAEPPVPPQAQANVGSFYDLGLTGLEGAPFDVASLKGKAVLVVNVASRCGFTPQYEGLQALYEQHKDHGLVILGVPCNQFGGQEPGSADEIASFCKMNYGVDFPLLEKQDVNGAQRSALYQFVVGSEVGGGRPVKWNFEKFLISPTGEVVGRYASSVDAADPKLLAAVESVLPKTE